MIERPFEAEYAEYERRAESFWGRIEAGQYGKFRGRLVKKLPYEEFVELYTKYLELKRSYDEIMVQGDTVNDAVVRLLEEHAAELLLST
jgi:hypothetical protein